MGRKKLAVTVLREKEQERKETFSKRCKGLFKKAHELSVLCGCEVMLAVLPGSPDDPRIYELHRRSSRRLLANPPPDPSPFYHPYHRTSSHRRPHHLHAYLHHYYRHRPFFPSACLPSSPGTGPAASGSSATSCSSSSASSAPVSSSTGKKIMIYNPVSMKMEFSGREVFEPPLPVSTYNPFLSNPTGSYAGENVSCNYSCLSDNYSYQLQHDFQDARLDCINFQAAPPDINSKQEAAVADEELSRSCFNVAARSPPLLVQASMMMNIASINEDKATLTESNYMNMKDQDYCGCVDCAKGNSVNPSDQELLDDPIPLSVFADHVNNMIKDDFDYVDSGYDCNIFMQQQQHHHHQPPAPPSFRDTIFLTGPTPSPSGLSPDEQDSIKTDEKKPSTLTSLDDPNYGPFHPMNVKTEEYFDMESFNNDSWEYVSRHLALTPTS